MSRIDEILQRVSNLPMLSSVASRLLTVIGDTKHSLKDVVSIVENDPALTARVLKIANSAAMSRGHEITTLSRAILQLGEKMVIGIAIGSCASQVYNRPLEGYESPEGELWDHSLLTAIASREISAYTERDVSPELSFTAGLLHDIGKSVISEFLRGNAEQMIQWLDTGNVEDFIQAERDLIGTDHAQVGMELAQHWSLPLPIIESIQFHHNPNEASGKFRDLVYVVHLGDIVAMLAGTSTGSDALAYKMDNNYTNSLKIKSGDIQKILLEAQQEFENTKSAIFAGGG